MDYYSGCTDCDHGFKATVAEVKKGQHGHTKACKCLKNKVWEYFAAKVYGLPGRYIATDFTKTDKTRLNRMKKAINFNESLYLHGNVGSGKTHLCVAALKYYHIVQDRKQALWTMCGMGRCGECKGVGCLFCDGSGWLDRGNPSRPRKHAIYVSCYDLIAECKESFNYSDVDSSKIFKRIMECKFLILDEFVTGLNSKHFSDEFFRLIDYRYNHDLQTFYVSNSSFNELRNADSRIASRIAEMCKSLKLSGGDKRLKE